ncbi:MAG: ribosome maturation factor RimP, partial [Clostridium sp.]|nr:ribosome maturation factor RimP [Clostridium sp.]
MTRKEIEKFVTKIASPIVNDHSIELVDVEFLKEGPEYYLRIYIDKPEGIKIDDCKFVSEKISDILDKEDPIPQRYFLEVS